MDDKSSRLEGLRIDRGAPSHAGFTPRIWWTAGVVGILLAVGSGWFVGQSQSPPEKIQTAPIAPVSAVLSKELLTVWNPIALEMVRTGALAAVFLFIFRDSIAKVSPHALRLLIGTNILTTVAWVLFFFGYQRLGIVHTLLLFSLQPFLVYLASLFILKEKPSRKRIIAFVVVLLSIGTAEWMNYMG